MRTSFNVRKKLILFACSIIVSSITFADMAVIVHPSNNSNFTPEIIKNIFLGKESKFPNGQIAIPMNAEENLPTYDQFNEKIIGRSRTQINAYWARLVFTGKGTMPKIISSDGEIVSTVSVNQGAISYIDSSAVTDKVKVVANF
ncbi:hypothetical protein ACU6U9_17440 [Pseudomonas sp. HK3]